PDLSCVTPLVALRRNTPGWFPFFSLRPSVETSTQPLGVGNPVHPIPGFRPQGRLRFSQVPRQPLCAFDVLSDSGRALMPSLHGILVLPPNATTRRASNSLKSFEALSHSFSTGCLRFVPPLLTTTQNSLPAVASFTGWDFTH